MPTILELLDGFKTYLIHERQRAKQTVESYTSDLRVLGRWIEKPVSDIGLDDMRRYMRQLSQDGMKGLTIERKFAAFSTFWRWCMMEGIVNQNIIELIDVIKRPQKIPKVLDEAQLMRFMYTLDECPDPVLSQRNHLAWMLMGWLAIRRSDVLNLRVGDVSLEDGHIAFRYAKGGNDAQLIIPSSDLRELLAKAIAQRDEFDYLMPGAMGGQWGLKQFVTAFRFHARLCDLPGWCTPHTIRHSVATMLKRRGADIFELQRLLRHKDIKTTMKYLQFDPAQLKETLARHVANTKSKR